MITIFEGARNSGKTFLANSYAQQTGTGIFKFDFVGWFSNLSVPDQDPIIHYFALGKEAMLLQLNRDGFLPNLILDRGFLTVLTWGIISERITKQTALQQLNILKDRGLLCNLKIVLIEGTNPSSGDRNKDFWDFRENSTLEKETLHNLIYTSQIIYPELKVVKIQNDFTNKSSENLINLI